MKAEQTEIVGGGVPCLLFVQLAWKNRDQEIRAFIPNNRNLHRAPPDLENARPLRTNPMKQESKLREALANTCLRFGCFLCGSFVLCAPLVCCVRAPFSRCRVSRASRPQGTPSLAQLTCPPQSPGPPSRSPRSSPFPSRTRSRRQTRPARRQCAGPPGSG